ncbi:hypothetical protein ACM9XA_03510 [Xanthomonas sacchari]
MSGQVDTFGLYVRAELEHWGREFALHRDYDYLGHVSKNMLQILIEHRGEMPPPNVGYKPLEIDLRAKRIEDIVADIARSNLPMACVLRAYYCGMGRRKVERYETAQMLLANAGESCMHVKAYLELAKRGEDRVYGVLAGMARAA